MSCAGSASMPENVAAIASGSVVESSPEAIFGMYASIQPATVV